MNRKVTRDEVIILMFFKLTWDSPRWFRPAVHPEHPAAFFGNGITAHSCWEQGKLLVAAGRVQKGLGGPLDGTKDLGVTAGACKGFCPWLVLALRLLSLLCLFQSACPSLVALMGSTASGHFCHNLYSFKIVMWHKVSTHHAETLWAPIKIHYLA